MESKEFLKYFINEDLYKVDESGWSSGDQGKLAEEIKSQQDVVSKVEEPIEKLEAPKPPSYKGDNQQGVLVLVEDATEEYLNDSDLTLLLKILSAVKLTQEDIALVNVVNAKNYKQLPFSKAIVFTSNHSFEIDNTQKYMLTDVGNKQLLFADPLSQIATSVDLKKALWGTLQQLF